MIGDICSTEMTNTDIMGLLENSSSLLLRNMTTAMPSAAVATHTLLTFYYYFYAIRVLVSVATVAGNVIVITCFMGFPAVRTSSNYFMMSLAVADLTSGPATLLSMITNICIGLTSWHVHGPCVIAISMNAVSLGGSIFSLLGIACERYVKVIYSLRYSLASNIS